jgi:hypothetical protein
MPNDIDDDPPISLAIADGWEEFAERLLPAIRGTEHAGAHVAVYFGAMYVLQLTQRVIEERSSDALSAALDMLDAELEEFIKSHAIVVQ